MRVGKMRTAKMKIENMEEQDMLEQMPLAQISLFPGSERLPKRLGRLQSSAAPERAAELDLGEALANAKQSLAADMPAPRLAAPAATPAASAEHEQENGGSRKSIAHLPGKTGGPDIYALCPGCEVHPDGGIYPAAELARAEGCPVGARFRAEAPRMGLNEGFDGQEECRRAEREGSAQTGSERRSSVLPSSWPTFFTGFRGTSSGAKAALASTLTRLSAERLQFHLTAPWRLCSGLHADCRRRLSRTLYFHRRRAICRRRLSQIASDPSWTS